MSAHMRPAGNVYMPGQPASHVSASGHPQLMAMQGAVPAPAATAMRNPAAPYPAAIGSAHLLPGAGPGSAQMPPGQPQPLPGQGRAFISQPQPASVPMQQLQPQQLQPQQLQLPQQPPVPGQQLAPGAPGGAVPNPSPRRASGIPEAGAINGATQHTVATAPGSYTLSAGSQLLAPIAEGEPARPSPSPTPPVAQMPFTSTVRPGQPVVQYSSSFQMTTMAPGAPGAPVLTMPPGSESVVMAAQPPESPTSTRTRALSNFLMDNQHSDGGTGFARTRTTSVSGTTINRKCIKSSGHGRANSLSLDSADAAALMRPRKAPPPGRVPRPAGPAHARCVSVSLMDQQAEQLKNGLLSQVNHMMTIGHSMSSTAPVGDFQGRTERVVKMCRDFLDLSFSLPVSREVAVTLDPGWAMRNVPVENAREICNVAMQIMSQQATLVEVAAPCKVFGDIHGQFSDLLLFLSVYGQPQHRTGDIEAVEYVFLGDLVDRGKQSVETILLMMCLKVAYPDRVWLVRGNHEDSDLNQRYGFKDECNEKYGMAGSAVYSLFTHAYSWMPLAALIEDRVLCIHGGLGHVDNKPISLDAIARIKRPFSTVFEETGDRIPREDWKVIMSLLWSDPTADCGEGNHASLRTGNTGHALSDDRQSFIRTFGPTIVKEFVEANDLDVVIRAHECVDKGFLFFAGGRLITVFSARNYAGLYENDAAFLLISRKRTTGAGGQGEFKLEITPKVLTAAGQMEPRPAYPQVGQRDVSPCRSMGDYHSEWGSLHRLIEKMPC
eukprot:TRINITY_DN28070_c0_g1_i1.p1 TRINITY_DN28070_c0_g1~~TRINITY_DN28070_c0_g1_i1.p1  ORF type:complete len:776 (+),score=123.87 TRINITY_DN28070_c0_g1_i1:50-2377(+)